MGDLILHKRCGVKGRYPSEDGKISSTSVLEYGEIAINYFKGDEFLSIANSQHGVVEFRPQYLVNVDAILLSNGEYSLSKDMLIEITTAYENGRVIIFQYSGTINPVAHMKKINDDKYVFLTVNHVNREENVSNINFLSITLEKNDNDICTIFIEPVSLPIPSQESIIQQLISENEFITQDNRITDDDIKNLKINTYQNDIY